MGSPDVDDAGEDKVDSQVLGVGLFNVDDESDIYNGAGQ